MADQIPLKLVTGSPNTVRRLVPGDTIDPVAVGVTSGVVVGTTMTQTLTNKTLNSPKIDKILSPVDGSEVIKITTLGAGPVNGVEIVNSTTGLFPEVSPYGTDANINLRLKGKGTGRVTVDGAQAVNLSAAQTLTNKTLTTPVIADFTNANHSHRDAANGGLLSVSAFAPGQGLARILYQNTADSAAVVNTTTETALTNSQYAFTFNAIANGGQVLRLTYAGKFSNTGTPTLTFRLRGSAGPITLAGWGPITTPAGVTNELWTLQIYLVVRAVGAGGSLYMTNPDTLRAGTAEVRTIAQTSAFNFVANGATATNLELTAIWGTANAANTITMEQTTIEALN